VGDGAHPHTATLDEADAHSLARQACRQRGDKGRRGAVETLVAKRAGEKVEDDLQSLPGRLGASGLESRRAQAMSQELEPAGSPLELTKRRVEIALGPRRDIQRDDTVDVPRGLNRIGDVVAIRARRGGVVTGLALQHDPRRSVSACSAASPRCAGARRPSARTPSVRTWLRVTGAKMTPMPTPGIIRHWISSQPR